MQAEFHGCKHVSRRESGGLDRERFKHAATGMIAYAMMRKDVKTPVMNLDKAFIETENPNAAPIGTKFGLFLFGDPLEIRTPDPLLKRQLLCQLS